MPKPAALVAGLSFATALGVVVWNASLQSDVDTLRRQLADTREAVVVAPAEPAPSTRVSRDGARMQSGLRDLEQRFAALEADLGPRSPLPSVPRDVPVASGGEAAPAAAGPGPAQGALSDAPESELEAAVSRVLDRREQERRRQRMEEQAERLVERVLEGLDVGDVQRSDLLRVVLDQMTRRDALRRDEGLTEEMRDARVADLDAERTAAVEGIFDGAALEQVRTRMDGARRGRRTVGVRNDGTGRDPGAAPGRGRRGRRLDRSE